MKTIEEGIYQDAYGFVVRARVGSGKNQRKAQKRFPLNTPIEKMRAWRLRALARLQEQPVPVRGTLADDCRDYLQTAHISAACKAQRTPQLAWWCAQSTGVGSAVLSPKQVKAEAEAVKRGEDVPVRRTLGDLPRTALDPKRLREILHVAFAPTDPDDPTQHASTSNSYRTALFHLFTELDQDDTDARNPVAKVQVRPQRGAQASGQDARIVAEILRHVPSIYGPSSRISELRLEVLAWVHITPKQLKGCNPLLDFHDVPNATREDMIAGAITLTKRPRLKGRKGKPIPAPETIPLNWLGVAAMRAFAAEPAAWGAKIPGSTAEGEISDSSLNRMIKRACVRAQASLKARGIIVDLSGFTLYHLKHSLATTASLASGGLVDRAGRIKQSPGVQKALDHAAAKTTSIYTQSAVDPIVRHVNAMTAQYLEHLFTVPLTAPAALKLVVK